MGLPLAGTHRPSRSHRFFMKNSGKFATSQWADRVVGPYNDPRSPPVGADASCPPAGCTDFTGIFGEFVTSHWADRVVGPYVKALLSPYPVGADDSVRPQDALIFMKFPANS